MSHLHNGARQRLASEADRAVVDGPRSKRYHADLLHSSGQPLPARLSRAFFRICLRPRRAQNAAASTASRAPRLTIAIAPSRGGSDLFAWPTAAVHYSARPTGPLVLSPGRVPERVPPLAPHTLHRIALLWSNLSGVSGRTSSIQRQSADRPCAGDMGLSTERQCNLRRTRIKPIRTMSL